MAKRFLWVLALMVFGWLSWLGWRWFVSRSPEAVPFAGPFPAPALAPTPVHVPAAPAAPAAPVDIVEPAAPAIDRDEILDGAAAATDAASTAATLDDAHAEHADADTTNDTGVIGYCVRCKAKRTMQHPHEETTDNGRRAARGTCPVCGGNMFTFLKEDAPALADSSKAAHDHNTENTA